MLNRVQIIGRLGKPPEMRFTANGTATTEFSVAASERYTSNGQQQERTEWFNVVTWARLAEICAEHLDKGRIVYVEGRLQTRSWDGNDGQKHYKTEVIANTVTFLGGGERREESPAVGDADASIEDLPF
jgi:single-strand DNA-binding protein